MDNYDQPWSNYPLSKVVKSLYKRASPMAVYPMEAMFEPGFIKFGLQWLRVKSRDVEGRTKVMKDMILRSDQLLRQSINELDLASQIDFNEEVDTLNLYRMSEDQAI